MDISESDLSSLTQDAFNNIIYTMAPEAVIALCSANNKLRTKCAMDNYVIYKNLIKRDFDLIADELHRSWNADKIYRTMVYYKDAIDALTKLCTIKERSRMVSILLEQLSNIIDLINEHFPEDGCPKWVIHPEFVKAKVTGMMERFYELIHQFIWHEEPVEVTILFYHEMLAGYWGKHVDKDVIEEIEYQFDMPQSTLLIKFSIDRLF
jgi:hypothetical protein